MNLRTPMYLLDDSTDDIQLRGEFYLFVDVDQMFDGIFAWYTNAYQQWKDEFGYD